VGLKRSLLIKVGDFGVKGKRTEKEDIQAILTAYGPLETVKGGRDAASSENSKRGIVSSTGASIGDRKEEKKKSG